LLRGISFGVFEDSYRYVRQLKSDSSNVSAVSNLSRARKRSGEY